MKKSGLTFLLLIAGLLPAAANESNTLLPESCSVGDRPFTAPLSWINFNFDSAISILDGASAIVDCDGETVAVASGFEVSNYSGKDWVQGVLTVFFDEQYLPKGKTCTVRLSAGSISKEDNVDIRNSDITQDFDIPENLGPVHIGMRDGSVITTVSPSIYQSFPTFFWGIETGPVGEPYFILYREGVQVKELPAHITWDWDLGQAYAEISETIHFEKGVNFTLTLPAGSAHAILRDDIVNEEASFNFIGGYTEPISTLDYTWCSLYTDHSNVLDVVTFTYDRPVTVAENAVIQLWKINEWIDCESELIMEAPAYINIDVNCWAVSADFQGFEMQPEEAYRVVIPEGTVIAEDGAVNARGGISLYIGAGIGQVKADIDAPESAIYDLHGTKVSNPQPGEIYVKEGKTFIHK